MSELLAPADWLQRRAAHRHRFDTLLGGYLARRAHGHTHPVIDFLFTYYNLRPGHLRRWHPGFGVTLTGAEADNYAALRGYRRTADGISVDPAHLAARRDTADYVARLLAATAARPAQLGCFGLHEWAMVYRTGDIRHSAPLRLGRDGTDRVVESMPLRCTHYDAYRFFTPAAAPRNSAALSRAGQLEAEQPGCLHAGMDLYRFAAKLIPLISSDLLWDAFILAYDARELDMRASPYELSEYGYAPVAIETPAGRAEYVRRQTALAERAATIRATLQSRCEGLLAAAVGRREGDGVSTTLLTGRIERLPASPIGSRRET